jgi:REP element-mobilizing transposase RayT
MIREDYWGDARLLCWVLMPDHWHGLVELGEREALSVLINRMKSVTTKRSHAVREYPRIWARGFHNRALRCNEDQRHAARYIVANPIRAELVQHICDYPYWDSIWL